MTLPAGHRFFARIMHLYPFYSGCGTLANRFATRYLSKKSSVEEWAQLRNGLSAHVPLNDFNGRAIYYAGDVDRKLSWICRRIIRTGDTALDIGANLGLVSLTLAQLVGDDGMVFAYEPNPRLIGYLKRSIAKNNFRNIQVYNCALGSEDTELMLTIPKYHSGKASLVRTSNSDQTLQVKVPVHRLDEILPESVRKIRLIKIDVEGFEYEVLKGATALFQRCPPDAVVFEINDAGKSVGKAPTIDFLQRRGYAFLSIPKTLLRASLRVFEPQRDLLPGRDLLAYRIGATGDELLNLLKI